MVLLLLRPPVLLLSMAHSLDTRLRRPAAHFLIVFPAVKQFIALMLHVTFDLNISYGTRACTGKEKRSVQIVFVFKNCN
jgi:hypothetical protein